MQFSHNPEEEIIVLLYEKNYHYGVGAFLNSAVRSQFQGKVVIGYRDELPPWIDQLLRVGDTTYRIGEMLITFEQVNPPMHLGYFKPYYLTETLQKNPICKKIFFFDADITVEAPWDFFSEWVENGIALCLDDCFGYLNHHHPWRASWRALWGQNVSEGYEVSDYANGGFIGLRRCDKGFLERWQAFTTKFTDQGGDIHGYHQRKQWLAIKSDQDLLNATISVSPDYNYSIIGKEGMGFRYPAYLMIHAVVHPKPWEANYLVTFLKNFTAPSLGDKAFMKNSQHPIRLFEKKQMFIKKSGIRIALLASKLIKK